MYVYVGNTGPTHWCYIIGIHMQVEYKHAIEDWLIPPIFDQLKFDFMNF